MQQRMSTAFEPVTTMQTQLVDQGAWVNQWVVVPTAQRTSLQWMRGGAAIDPVTGTSFWRRGGLYWTQPPAVGTLAMQAQYVPNVVAVQQPQTTMVARPVIEQHPVQVTRFVDEVVTQRIPVQVTRMEQHEEIREVPVTVQRPVVERVEQQVPVQTLRWVQQEVVRKVPVTTQRIVHEERVEQVPVQVYRMVQEVQTVQRPRTTATWVPHASVRTVPRTVVMRVPLNSAPVTIAPPTTTYYHAAPSIITAPPVDDGISTRRIPAEPAPVVDDSWRQDENARDLQPIETEPGAGERGHPDHDPTGQPSIDPDEIPLLEPAGSPYERTRRPDRTA
jgi:hypothetical protein